VFVVTFAVVDEDVAVVDDIAVVVASVSLVVSMVDVLSFGVVDSVVITSVLVVGTAPALAFGVSFVVSVDVFSVVTTVVAVVKVADVVSVVSVEIVVTFGDFVVFITVTLMFWECFLMTPSSSASVSQVQTPGTKRHIIISSRNRFLFVR